MTYNAPLDDMRFVPKHLPGSVQNVGDQAASGCGVLHDLGATARTPVNPASSKLIQGECR
jgi:hypothetical protein